MKLWTPQEEAERLKARFEQVKNREKFARDHGIKGGGTMIYQHITGRRPISIEAALAYAEGFDCPLDEISPALASQFVGKFLNKSTPNNADEDAKKSEEITILQYSASGSMGNGVMLRDQPGEINSWKVTPEWITKNVKNHSGSQHLAIVTGFGDSMKGMFNSGDPLLVDRGINSFNGDAVYFFRVGDEGFIKRLQKIPGEGIIASSENKSYRDWVIRPDMDFEIFARVIKVWNSTDL